jgi:hypothetical protein
MPAICTLQMQASVSAFVDSDDFLGLRKDMENFDAQRESIIKRSRGMLDCNIHSHTLPYGTSMALVKLSGFHSFRHPEAGEAGNLCSAPEQYGEELQADCRGRANCK